MPRTHRKHRWRLLSLRRRHPARLWTRRPTPRPAWPVPGPPVTPAAAPALARLAGWPGKPMARPARAVARPALLSISPAMAAQLARAHTAPVKVCARHGKAQCHAPYGNLGVRAAALADPARAGQAARADHVAAAAYAAASCGAGRRTRWRGGNITRPFTRIIRRGRRQRRLTQTDMTSKQAF